MTSPEQPGNWSDPTAPTPPSGEGVPEAPTAPTAPSSPPAAPSPPPAVGSVPAPLPAPTSPTEQYPTYAAPPPYPPPAPPHAGYAYGPVAPPTSGLAIAALVVAIVACGPAGAIMGHIARTQIRERGEQGDGIALAAIIVGWTLTGLGVLACCGIFAIPAMFGGASVFSQ